MCIRDSGWGIMHQDTLRTAMGEFGHVTTGNKKEAVLQGQLCHKNGEMCWWNGYITLVEKQGVPCIFGWMRPAEHALSADELNQNAVSIPGLSANFDCVSPGELACGFAGSRKCVPSARPRRPLSPAMTNMCARNQLSPRRRA
eukprot:TRINITY_DN39473_c0_g1_i1.p1 TRINITY_DN39473_c0_g1~~TRINITY_DN39473_c0_g1_i1.p1  ORF type:complete len:143 (+),score=21.76 TRINITY_DN39473_c0_g1_i1:96-524(+)